MHKKPLPLYEKYPEYFSKLKPESDICNCACHHNPMIMHCMPCCHHCSFCEKRILSHKLVEHEKKCQNKE